MLGVAYPPAGSWCSHSTRPECDSNARIFSSAVAATNRSPPAVATTPPKFIEPVLRMPLATSCGYSPSGTFQRSSPLIEIDRVQRAPWRCNRRHAVGIAENCVALNRVSIGRPARRLDRRRRRRTREVRGERGRLLRTQIAERRHAVAALADDRLELLWALLQVDERRRLRRRALPFRSVARNAAALVDSPAKLCRSLWSVRGRIVDGPKAVDGRRVVHIDVEDIQEWIEGATVPFASAQVAWLREGALRAWRRVDGSGPILPEFLQRMLACGRRDVREVGFGERLAHQWDRLYRNRLRRPRLFARHSRIQVTGTSFTGNNGWPVSRSSTNVNPIFVS